MMFNGYNEELVQSIKAWLREDVGSGDVTTQMTIPVGHESKGIIHAKEDGIICGIPIAELVFEIVDPALSFTALVEEGQAVTKGTVIIEVEGSTHAILTGERLALNLMQRLSGVASRTASFVQVLEGLPTRLVDTRKTTPGHRMLEKYAVRIGGGFNHRFGLYDAVMIKDNHIKGAGGIRQAVGRARKNIPHTMSIEVETENLEQVEEALAAGADIIMLDNMSNNMMKQAVARIKSKAPHVKTEASGNVSLETLRGIAETGVDVISVGRLTYSFSSLDISLDLNAKKEGPLS
ncbi:nicotinate-nucleotide diphosphorylase (carboxylating) [Paenibacillus odorifer]|jgi:nicotinate-nucleotide pyrophosphorylase (carboxylating)|uniref:carboxylating nicotinate-nucleotide diphosphorylase n=1 Tax=Paenibacillus TaxID=44249 RepID=UPI00096F40B4|nr:MULTISPECIES: carboxylating nicotinate-nucleotide diphosphorylase [Paenibacillus]MDH6431385.1 nicotinate-nucleotide pyrophosphorylase (carboxylating) [Paenibacillus sp. PastH-4]MDH6447451.1 nicotinate-nucleotide pyrophosphorylase (carboxylating) [Paenibacillus sp. PastF-4]MDH6531563.1 nicotinate-nucleotide pyrophosphorylase (carboxylating) [Paenibacillus sp. PastH-3]OMC62832.1 nicotinate-nucleotide diphosphorylase (carboxylating) [Paenibacillus odorifer]OMC67072.1 nicotinate-nucleotide diph